MPAPSESGAVDVCIVGSANLDLVTTTARLPASGETVNGTSFATFAGGKGLNQAIAARRAGATVAFVGAVGDDDAGTTLTDALAAAGVASHLVRRIARVPTGRALITVDDAGANTIVVVPGANAHAVADALPPARIVVAQLEVPIDVVLRAFTLARSRGARTVLDPAPARPLPADLLSLVDVLVPNEHEVGVLGGVDVVLAAGVDTVITTRGAAGARVDTAGGGWVVAGMAIRPVDTTAAGDSFCGHFAAALAGGASIEEAVERANVAGGLATLAPGAVPSIPTAADVDAALSGAAAPPPNRLG